MKKLLSLFVFAFLLSLALAGCSRDHGYQEKETVSDEDEGKVVLQSTPNRKIIYNVTVDLYIEWNFQEKVNDLIESIYVDEWTDYLSISDSQAYIIFRIKTQRLDAFIYTLSDFGEVRNLTKKGTDISLQYQDNENRIISLESERARLVELFEDADMAEIIQINKRISEIDKELGELKGENAIFDSLIDYSEVKVSVYNETPDIETENYWDKLKKTFNSGIDAFVKFFEYIFLGIVMVFPFLLLSGAAVGTTLLLRKVFKKRREDRKALNCRMNDRLEPLNLPHKLVYAVFSLEIFF